MASINRRRYMLPIFICVLIAVFLKLYPYYVLKVPTYGFIIYSIIMGGVDPPLFTDRSCFKSEEFRTWIKPKDVIVSAAPKSGTTFMLYLCHLIRIKGEIKKYPFIDVNLNTPWTSLLHKPGQTWKELKSLMNTTILSDNTSFSSLWNHPEYPFRVFKAHESPRLPSLPIHIGVLPVREFPEVKFIAMSRNFIDCAASWIEFSVGHDEEFRAMWGGFPASLDKAGVVDLFTGKFVESFADAFLGYAVAWWEFRHDKNVLYLHYNDIVNGKVDLIKRVAAFLEVSLSEDEIKSIDELTTLSAMKKEKDKFIYRLWGNTDLRNGEGRAMKPGGMIRKGVTGDGLASFDDDQMRRLVEYEERYMAAYPPEIKKWVQDGKS